MKATKKWRKMHACESSLYIVPTLLSIATFECSPESSSSFWLSSDIKSLSVILDGSYGELRPDPTGLLPNN